MRSETQDTEQQLLSRRGVEILVATITLAFGATIIYGAIEYDIGWGDRGPQPGYFPFWIGLLIVLGSVGSLVRAVLARNLGAQAGISIDQAKRMLAFVVPVVAFLALTSVMGLYVAMAAYLFAVMILQGRYSPLLAAAVSIGATVCFYLMFDIWLHVPLLKGPLETWLGLN